MCTVTLVPTRGPDATGFRMACSRDEQHGRADALPPQTRTFKTVRYLMPIDPGSGGTWVAVNEFGLALTLLNYNLPDPPTGHDLSRGGVIPALIYATTVQEVLALASAIERQRMRPFRLVACDGVSLMLWRSTEPVDAAQITRWDGEPVMYTSSGLGDHLVEPPRRELFNGWFGNDASVYADKQLAFHRHQWPGQSHLSVCMQRDDARTVSYTTVDITPKRMTMSYHPDRPDMDAKPSVAVLERHPVQR